MKGQGGRGGRGAQSKDGGIGIYAVVEDEEGRGGR